MANAIGFDHGILLAEIFSERFIPRSATLMRKGREKDRVLDSVKAPDTIKESDDLGISCRNLRLKYGYVIILNKDLKCH